MRETYRPLQKELQKGSVVLAQKVRGKRTKEGNE
jgi:hypothetical protein